MFVKDVHTEFKVLLYLLCPSRPPPKTKYPSGALQQGALQPDHQGLETGTRLLLCTIIIFIKDIHTEFKVLLCLLCRNRFFPPKPSIHEVPRNQIIKAWKQEANYYYVLFSSRELPSFQAVDHVDDLF